jgi:hypothetical protein
MHTPEKETIMSSHDIILGAAGTVAALYVFARMYSSAHHRAFSAGHSAALAVVRQHQATRALELRQAGRRRGRGGRGPLVLTAAVAGVAAWFGFLRHHLDVKAVTSAGKAVLARVHTAAPKPVVTVPAPRVPPVAVHSSSFPLSGTEIVIIAIVLICGLVAYGINRVRARES